MESFEQIGTHIFKRKYNIGKYCIRNYNLPNIIILTCSPFFFSVNYIFIYFFINQLFMPQNFN